MKVIAALHALRDVAVATLSRSPFTVMRQRISERDLALQHLTLARLASSQGTPARRRLSPGPRRLVHKDRIRGVPAPRRGACTDCGHPIRPRAATTPHSALRLVSSSTEPPKTKRTRVRIPGTLRLVTEGAPVSSGDAVMRSRARSSSPSPTPTSPSRTAPR